MCYCGTTVDFTRCCEPYILGLSTAPTPEALMRSRYSAYVIKHAQYIHDSYAPEQRQANSIEDIKAFAQSCHFIKLNIIASHGSQVEFEAHYIQDKQHCVLHERSNFVKQEQGWFYQDGELFAAQTKALSRNSLCPCASGKKYKRCHAA